MQFNNPPVIDNKQAIYTVTKFDLPTYEDFIKIRTLPHYEVNDKKIIFSAAYLDHYYEAQQKLPIPLQKGQFDYQEVIEKVAFFKERYAIFADAGLGKTYMLYQLALFVLALTQKTQGKIIICVPLNILSQFIEMSSFFDNFPEYVNLHQNKEMTLKEWCHYDNVPRIAFVNHHYFVKPQKLKNVEAFLLDECSILKGGKGGNGKIAKHLIEATRNIRYRYAASATPAPNDRLEYGMVAWFLGVVNSLKEFEANWFVNKDGVMTLRRHSHKRFYAHLASWSIFIRDPKSYGFEDNLKNLKPYREIHKRVELTLEQQEIIKAFATTKEQQIMLPSAVHNPGGIVKRNKFSEISKGFYYKNVNGKRQIIPVKSNKPQVIVDTVLEHRPEQIIIAVYFDEEGKILNQLLSEHGLKTVHITGKTDVEERARLLNEFRLGNLDALISQIDLIGKGLNLQYCRISIVSGMTDSYEQYYQFIKRTHRYGQDKQVLIYHVYTVYEEVILQNVLGKKKEHELDFQYQERLYIDSLYDELKDYLEMEDYTPMAQSEMLTIKPIINDRYELYHGDSKRIMFDVVNKKNYYSLWPNSIDFSVFSKPFMGDLFTYSDHPADMGNTRGAGATGGVDEFMLDCRFFFEGMKIVTKPGRIMCCHMEDVPLRKGLDGSSGLFDFPGRANIEAVNAGWILVGKVTIPKNQQMQSIVKHVSNLTMGNMATDRLRIAPAMNGYLYIYRKPGNANVKIADWYKCRNCGKEGYTANLQGYDIIQAKGQMDIKMAHYAVCSCPDCYTQNPYVFTEMDGDKWVMYAEGAWPENGFNDNFPKLANQTKSERWLDLVYQTLGIWPDILESDVLKNPFRGKGKMSNELEDSDKHLCPLPMSIARRSIELYTMPNDVVFDPFVGSGTTIVEALKLNRKAIGIELKPEYFMMTTRNVELAIAESQQLVFDF